MGPGSRTALVGASLALLSCALAFGVGSAGAAPDLERRAPVVKPRPKPKTREQLLQGFDPRVRNLMPDGALSSPLEGDHGAVLTLHAGLDDFVSKLLNDYDVPFGGVVAVEPATGRLLAYVSHSSAEPGVRDQVLDASAPSASVFKVITSAALLDHGVGPNTTTCYHGGASALTAGELSDNPRLDSACISLSSALGSSVNVVFGKLALKHLDAQRLTRYASAFGFGQTLPFDAPTEPSRLDVPVEPVEFARTAAGFWHTHMSPLHAAMIVSTIANQGRMMRPYIIDRIVDAKGDAVSQTEPELHRSVIERRTAEQVGQMMRTTITQGTARKTFYDHRGHPFLPGIDVAGKTGTLSKERPYRGYTWWVGFAPVDKPRIAIAALVVNSPKWRIKAGFVAREALHYYLIDAPKQQSHKVARQSHKVALK